MLNSYNDIISCSYCNLEGSVQIVRISEPASGGVERTVAPGQCIYFTTSATSLLEIYELGQISLLHADTIACRQLRIPSIDTYARKETSKNSAYAEVA